MTAVKALLGQFQKKHGDAIGSFGGTLHDAERIPTSMFPFDLASGGGFPRGRAAVIFGPESSGKTNLALMAVVNHQAMFPDKICVFFDLEHSYDPKWAALLGVDPDRIIVMSPDYAEQCVDQVESMLAADDVGLVVVDSIAALVTSHEISSDAEKVIVGGSAITVGKMVRKSTLSLAKARKSGHYPSLIYINQIRMKVGVLFGSPETMPGGYAPLFQSALTVRTYGKNVVDSKVNEVMPILKQTDFVIRKWKVPIMATHGNYKMVTYPHNGFKVGEVDDWNTVVAYLKNYDLLTKDKKGWLLKDGATYAKQDIIKERMKIEPEFGRHVRQMIVDAAMATGSLDPSEEETEE